MFLYIFIQVKVRLLDIYKLIKVYLLSCRCVSQNVNNYFKLKKKR